MNAGADSPVPPDPRLAWIAAIEWRESEEGARFVVVAHPAGDGAPATIAESPPLDWPPADAGSVQGLVEAVGELQDALASAGWAPAAPGRAWYARRFAWEPPRVPTAAPSSPAAPAATDPTPAPALFAPRPPWPESTVDRWRCEIAWDAGWASSRFRALAYPPGARRGRELSASRPLKWLLMAQPDPASAEHRSELEDLAGALADRGWAPLGKGASWYAERFCWPDDAPTDQPAIPTQPEAVA